VPDAHIASLQDVEGEPLDAVEGGELMDLMRELLTRRTLFVLTPHFGLGDERKAYPLEAVGRAVGLGREMVRQVELGALARLRRALESGRRCTRRTRSSRCIGRTTRPWRAPQPTCDRRGSPADSAR
jgi:DNA-directed RNA polymerase sigma subunit (sigma70/sigma32)